MAIYQRSIARVDSKEEEALLAAGWEPFAVTKEPVYDDRLNGWRSTGEDSFVWFRRKVEDNG